MTSLNYSPEFARFTASHFGMSPDALADIEGEGPLAALLTAFEAGQEAARDPGPPPSLQGPHLPGP